MRQGFCSKIKTYRENSACQFFLFAKPNSSYNYLESQFESQLRKLLVYTVIVQWN